MTERGEEIISQMEAQIDALRAPPAKYSETLYQELIFSRPHHRTWDFVQYFHATWTENRNIRVCVPLRLIILSFTRNDLQLKYMPLHASQMITDIILIN